MLVNKNLIVSIYFVTPQGGGGVGAVQYCCVCHIQQQGSEQGACQQKLNCKYLFCNPPGWGRGRGSAVLLCMPHTAARE